MKIAVIGAGYVGLVSAACFAELGHEVITVDNDSEKIKLLIEGQVPIHENLLPELIHRHFGNRLRFSGDIVAAVEGSDVVFITVGTPPSPNGEADLSVTQPDRLVQTALDVVLKHVNMLFPVLLPESGATR